MSVDDARNQSGRHLTRLELTVEPEHLAAVLSFPRAEADSSHWARPKAGRDIHDRCCRISLGSANSC